MPIIPPQFLSCVCFLYQTRNDAENGENTGGTGFFVAIPTDDGLGHHYCVTNWHVAVRDGFSVIRVNKPDGGIEIFERGPEDWEFDAGKEDIAITPLDLHGSNVKAYFIGSQLMKTQKEMEDLRVGPGDDIFMVGRFVDLAVRETNIPALRFGNISTPPVPIEQPTQYLGTSYCIDMHSRSGYSGSPVFVYRTPGNSLEWVLGRSPQVLDGGLLLLLGIHWGQFPEQLKIIRQQLPAQESSVAGRLFSEYVEGLSGMTCVIPAWQITNLLNCEKFVRQRAQMET